jgi:hypothetical protein
MGAAAAVVVAAAGLVTVNAGAAFGDAAAPPRLNTNTCPPSQAPPPGYPNPPPLANAPYVYPNASYPNLPGFPAFTPHRYSGPIPYEVPFQGTIGSPGNAGGTLKLNAANPSSPNLVVPHIYAAVCGVINLPSLIGTIPAGSVTLASGDTANGRVIPNVLNAYIGGVEVFPLTAGFGTLTATVSKTPAFNGGLDVVIHGSTTASLDATPSLDANGNPTISNTLGTNCPLTIPDIPLTTLTSGAFSGQPVTGGFHSGVALAVANNFSVPAAQASASCPPALAYTINKLLNLPAPPGAASLSVPVTFDFRVGESPPYNKDLMCPCPP